MAAFLETGAFVGLVAPGETIVMAAGVVAGQGTIDLLPLIGIVWLSAVLGDTTSFFIGKRLGRRSSSSTARVSRSPRRGSSRWSPTSIATGARRS